MTAHNVILDVLLVFYGDANLVVFVHNIYGEILGEPVPFDDLPVVLRRVAIVFFVKGTAGIGGVALHYGAVHLEDQIFDEFRLQIVGVAALAGTHLDGHATLGRNAQCLVNLYERLWSFVLCVNPNINRKATTATAANNAIFFILLSV